MKIYSKFIRNCFLPYLTLDYYLIYLQFWQEINVFKNRNYSLFITSLQLTILYHSGIQILFHFLEPSDFTRLILYDSYHLLLPLKGMNAIAGIGFLTVVAFYQLFYFIGDEWSNGMFYQILFRRRTKEFFQWSKVDGVKIVDFLRAYVRKILLVFRVVVLYGCK